MKKVIFLISMLVAILFACVPAPVKAQDPAHEYVVAALTTPIGRWLNVAQKNFISVQATGARYQITKSCGPTESMASIIIDGHYVAQTGTATLSAITASLLPNASATYNLGSSTYKWQDMYLSRNALIGGTLGVTGVLTATGGVVGTVTGAASLNELLTNKKTASSTSNTFYYSCLAINARIDSIAALLARITGQTFTGEVIGTTVGASGLDTVTTASVGTISYRAADSTLWVKIKATGPKSARWNKISKTK